MRHPVLRGIVGSIPIFIPPNLPQPAFINNRICDLRCWANSVIFRWFIMSYRKEKQRTQTPCYTQAFIFPTPSFSQTLLAVAATCSNDARSSTPLVDIKTRTSFFHTIHNNAPPPSVFHSMYIHNSNIGPEAVHTQHEYMTFIPNSFKAENPTPPPLYDAKPQNVSPDVDWSFSNKKAPY